MDVDRQARCNNSSSVMECMKFGDPLKGLLLTDLSGFYSVAVHLSFVHSVFFGVLFCDAISCHPGLVLFLWQSCVS